MRSASLMETTLVLTGTISSRTIKISEALRQSGLPQDETAGAMGLPA